MYYGNRGRRVRRRALWLTKRVTVSRTLFYFSPPTIRDQLATGAVRKSSGRQLRCQTTII
jgi:hypothetical protein